MVEKRNEEKEKRRIEMKELKKQSKLNQMEQLKGKTLEVRIEQTKIYKF